MSYLIRFFTVAIVLLLPINAALSSSLEKNFTIGLSPYLLRLSYDAEGVSDDNFQGAAANLTYAPVDNVAVKGNIYSLEHDEESDINAEGLDLLIVVGTGLATKGFKLYGGGGLYIEDVGLSSASFEERFSGIQFSGGAGYNWTTLSLEFFISVRDTGDYARFIESADVGVTGKMSAISSNLSFAMRF